MKSSPFTGKVVAHVVMWGAVLSGLGVAAWALSSSGRRGPDTERPIRKTVQEAIEGYRLRRRRVPVSDDELAPIIFAWSPSIMSSQQPMEKLDRPEFLVWMLCGRASPQSSGDFSFSMPRRATQLLSSVPGCFVDYDGDGWPELGVPGRPGRVLSFDTVGHIIEVDSAARTKR